MPVVLILICFGLSLGLGVASFVTGLFWWYFAGLWGAGLLVGIGASLIRSEPEYAPTLKTVGDLRS